MLFINVRATLFVVELEKVELLLTEHQNYFRLLVFRLFQYLLKILVMGILGQLILKKIYY